jgi:hypothetical protein
MIAPAASTSSAYAPQPVRQPIARVAAPLPASAIPSSSAITAQQVNAAALVQRQRIAEALFDRSLTFDEGVDAFRTQSAIAAYAKALGPATTEPENLAAIAARTASAEDELASLRTNAAGADLDSDAGIDGGDLDKVQDDLARRIAGGLKDGSLTAQEGAILLRRQQAIADREAASRGSDGKLIAGEQKALLDDLRKSADEIGRLRRNDLGINIAQRDFSAAIDTRQAGLEKRFAAALKRGTLTESEATAFREQLDAAQAFKETLAADGKIDSRDRLKLTKTLNDADLALY